MKTSDKPTKQILIKANTGSEWDCCEFALIHISEQWMKQQAERLEAIKPLTSDSSFQSTRYYTNSVEFYQSGDNGNLDIEQLLSGKDWVFVELEEDEQDRHTPPENSLDFYKIVIYRDGNARFEAFGKHTNEEFWTNEFPLQQLTEQLLQFLK
ncbi:hypothetical protein ACGE0T_12680 [Parabacteroides sp. APC149_11_2_Y6]